MEITKLDHMFEALRNSPKKILVAAYANDEHSISAVNQAIDLGLIEGTLVGDEATIKQFAKHTLLIFRNLLLYTSRMR